MNNAPIFKTEVYVDKDNVDWHGYAGFKKTNVVGISAREERKKNV